MAKTGLKKSIKLLVILAIIYLIAYNAPQLVKILYPLKFDSYIIKYSNEYKMEPSFVAAVIKTESNFQEFAESGKGAKGLMQITSSTGCWIAQKLKVEDFQEDMLFDPETNIRFGCWYIKHLYEYYGNDIKLIMAAYNGGMGNVDKWLKDRELSYDGLTLDNIPFKETEEFVKRIEKNHKIYSFLYNEL